MDRLYLSKNEGGRGLNSIGDCVRGDENSLGWYVKNSTEELIVSIEATGAIKQINLLQRVFLRRKEEQS